MKLKFYLQEENTRKQALRQMCFYISAIHFFVYEVQKKGQENLNQWMPLMFQKTGSFIQVRKDKLLALLH